jgi:hypothetical protein
MNYALMSEPGFCQDFQDCRDFVKLHRTSNHSLILFLTALQKNKKIQANNITKINT